MLTTNVFIASLTLCTLLFAIGCDRMDTQAIDKIDEVSADDNNIVIAATPEAWGTDAYVINAATIKDGTLHINVSYTGGCEPHVFTLVAEPRFLESFPVQMQVSLAHNANGDTCKVSLTEDYSFDLTPLKEIYQKGYRTDHGTIILRLKDAPSSNLAYDF